MADHRIPGDANWIMAVLDEDPSKLLSILDELETRIGDPNYPVLTCMEDIVTAVINEIKEEGRPY